MDKYHVELFKAIRQLTVSLYRERIAVDEFVKATIDNLSRYDIAVPHAAELWLMIPDKCREEFVAEILRIVQPDYLHSGYKYGGERPVTEEEVLGERKMYTNRVRVWAVKLIELFDAGHSVL